jgi:hypothetical protein
MKYIFLLIFIICCKITVSQINLYTTNPIDWDSVKIPNTAVEPRFLNENAVILYEEQSIAIEHANVYLTKLYRITFNTAEGIKRYSSFFVPQSNDVFSDYYYIGLDKQDKVNRPAYNDYEIVSCAARYVKPPKSYTEVDIKSTQVNERWYNDYTYLPTIGFTIAKNNSFIWEPNKGQSKPASFNFSLSEVRVGDTYDVYYRVRVPLITFLKSASSRIIFNSAVPKQIYKLKLSYESEVLYVSFINNNIALPPDTTFGKDKFLTNTLIYKANNLIGYEKELNMRPYELPHVYFYINSRDYLKPSVNDKVVIAPYDWSHMLYKTTYKIQNNSMMQGKTTLTFDYIKPYNKHYTAPYDEIFVPRHMLEHYITFTDKHNSAVTRLYAKCMEGIDPATDLSCAQRVQKFHNNVVEQMEYYTCKERYEKDENLYSVGELAADKNKLFENGRYRLYADFLYRTECNFYRTRMVDKRTEILNPATYFPPNATVDFFSIINNRTFECIFPKASRFGYYVDEYPFYFESTNAVTTPYRIVDTSGLMPPSFTKTHNSGFSSNIRIHTYTVTIDAAANTCSFDGNISLSGQFSTLTRSAYSHNLVSDSSVNRDYYKKLTDQLGPAQNVKTKVISTENKFPFKCKVSQSFTLNNLCLRSGDDYTIDLSKLSCHVMEQVENRERNMTWYSDFLMHDVFRYTFVFAKPITIKNEEQLKTTPSVNSFGAYFNKLSVVSPTQLNFESNFKILSEKMPASAYREVVDFYQNTAKNNHLVLIFSQN